MALENWLREQLAGHAVLLDEVLEATSAADRAPAPGQWSARENVAHLARHQRVFLERLDRILGEERPALGRYRAEDDPAWPEWSRLPLEECLRRHHEDRRLLLRRLEALSADDLRRTAIHPALGELTLLRWIEFLLVHEGHHLYLVFKRARGVA